MALAAVLGGAGQGFARQANIANEQEIQRSSLDVRREALALQERLAEQQRQSQLDELAREDFQRFLDVAVEGKTAALEEGRSEAEIAGLIVPLREQSLASVRLRAQGRPGATPQSVQQEIEQFTTEFDAKLNSLVAPEVSAASEGRADVAGAAARATALSELGVQTTTRQAAEAAGLVAEPKPAKPLIFRMPDNTFQSFDANDAAGIQRAIDSGAVGPVNLGVQAATASDLLTGVSKKTVEEARESVQTSQADIEELERSIAQFEANPEAGGIAGTVIENVGGFLQQFGFGPILESAGIDPAKVKEVRSQARLVVSRLLSTITAEESGRFTDRERQIAEQALGALDETASPEQIKAAGTTALQMMRRAQSRELNKLLIASGANLAEPEGEQRFVEILIRNGFETEAAIDAMLDLQERLGLKPERTE